MTESAPLRTESTPRRDSPLVLLLDCDEVAPRLEEAGIVALRFDGLEPLLMRARQVQARACLVRSSPQSAPKELVRTLRRELPFTEVVVWLPAGTAAGVREALTGGARDVVLEEEAAAAAAAVRTTIAEQKVLPRMQRFDKKARQTWRFEGIVSRSQKMWDIFETCIRVAQTSATVLLLGETGTGKELVARAIHQRSHRAGRFVGFNCGAVAEPLIDSELFGHKRGAFTGAVAEKHGLFRHADSGTLFLDEIGAVPLGVQYHLLRALQEGAIRPVGGDEELPIDARVIAATSTPLDQAVLEGTFRDDLLYRLDVIRIVIPPLRERREDVILLFEYFADKLAREYKLQRPEVSDEFLDALEAYDWPGNVRQLENYVERLLLTSQGRLTEAHFSRLVRPFSGR